MQNYEPEESKQNALFPMTNHLFGQKTISYIQT